MVASNRAVGALLGRDEIFHVTFLIHLVTDTPVIPVVITGDSSDGTAVDMLVAVMVVHMSYGDI